MLKIKYQVFVDEVFFGNSYLFRVYNQPSLSSRKLRYQSFRPNWVADDFYLWFALIRPLIVFARKFLFSLSTHDIQYFLSRHKSNEILKVQKIRAAKSIVENYTLSQKGYTRRQKLDDFMKYDTEMGLDHTCTKKHDQFSFAFSRIGNVRIFFRFFT